MNVKTIFEKDTLMDVGFMRVYPLNEKMMMNISAELAAWRGKKTE